VYSESAPTGISWFCFAELFQVVTRAAITCAVLLSQQAIILASFVEWRREVAKIKLGTNILRAIKTTLYSSDDILVSNFCLSASQG